MKELKEIKRLLIVVDMVNGFVNEGNMADPYIAHIIPKIEETINDFINEEEGVFFIRDSHPENAAEFRKFPVHCLEGTSESELVPELQPYESYGFTFRKNSTSTMFAEGFTEALEEMEALEEVTVCGCCSDICVLNLAVPLTNYFDQKERRIQVYAPADLMETYDAPVHNREEYNRMTLLLMNQAGIVTEGR